MITGRYARGEPFDRKYHVAHVSRRFHRRYAIPHEEILPRLDGMLAMHNEVPRALSGAMGDYTYMIRSADLAELQAPIADVEREA